jgi:hypothetical protein
MICVFFFSQFCDVAMTLVAVTITHKGNQPNFAIIGQRGKWKILRILLYFGDLLESIV